MPQWGLLRTKLAKLNIKTCCRLLINEYSLKIKVSKLNIHREYLANNLQTATENVSWRFYRIFQSFQNERLMLSFRQSHLNL